MHCHTCRTTVRAIVEHNGECHRCPHSAEVTAGRYRNTPWMMTPCSACYMTDDGNSSQPSDDIEWRGIRHGKVVVVDPAIIDAIVADKQYQREKLSQIAFLVKCLCHVFRPITET